jgi:hypothetical protein
MLKIFSNLFSFYLLTVSLLTMLLLGSLQSFAGDKIKCMVKAKEGMDSTEAKKLKEKIHSEVAFLIIKWNERQAEEFIDDIECFKPVDKGHYIEEWTNAIKHKRGREWKRILNKHSRSDNP